MAKYIANPVEVDAFRIDAVHLIGDNYSEDRIANLLLDDGKTATATQDMMARITPQIGDYYVVQSDGYIYLNPKAVFERKYRKME